MSSWFGVLVLCMAIPLGGGCSPSDTAAPKNVPRIRSNESQKADLLVAELVRMSSGGDSEEESFQQSAFLSRYGSVDPCGCPRLNHLLKAEEDLLAIGKGAFPAMIATAARPDTHPVLRKALVDLSARMTLGLEEVRGLLGLLENEPVEWVRIACVEAVALQRSERFTPTLMALEGRPQKIAPHILHWALEMSGQLSSASKFLDHVESVLAAEELESPLGDLGIAKGEPLQDIAQVILLAKVTESNKWLSEDIWRAGQLGTKRAICVLIKALRFHQCQVQHMALFCLQKLVDAEVASKNYPDSELHTLNVAKTWESWWTKCESKLSFDPQARRYSIKE